MTHFLVSINTFYLERPSGKDTQLHEDGVWVQVHDDLTFSTSLNIDVRSPTATWEDSSRTRSHSIPLTTKSTTTFTRMRVCANVQYCRALTYFNALEDVHDIHPALGLAGWCSTNQWSFLPISVHYQPTHTRLPRRHNTRLGLIQIRTTHGRAKTNQSHSTSFVTQ